ncbi:MAG: DUF1622 domain-containing protein [Firmicutes bacterium]|nr:DUF1622 domain-containing protein [Bacillota bacterium]
MTLEAFESALNTFFSISAHILEIFGAFIIIFASIKTFIYFLSTRSAKREATLSFARFLVFGLEFKMAGEILRTVIVRSLSEILILAAVIVLRFLLNLILQWEIHQEDKVK